jgi:thiol-disulfide isomerase/thioredoxin
MNTLSNKTKLAGAITALLLSLSLVTAAPPKEGDPFPDLASFGLEGTLPDLKGKIVLVDFFASWCGPCKESFPAMETLHKKYAAQGVVILAINVDKKKTDMEDFLKEHPVTFTVVRDASNKLVGSIKVPTMPSSFVLDRTGKVVSFHRGFKGDETLAQYHKDIESLLK